MTNIQDTLEDEVRDRPADERIRQDLLFDAPQSFFLFAGAGSGKTRSLKEALDGIVQGNGEKFRRRGWQVGVITYTNAARDEILRRVKHDPIFHVATIHSFAWSLVDGRTDDIRKWLQEKLPKEIAELEDAQARGRGGKAADDRVRKIESKRSRLQDLEQIEAFTYNPNGDNFGRDSLSHEEVISMTSEFMETKLTLQKIILCRYPFLLIDESQDTLRPFMEALLSFEETYKGQFVLGLFGDTMQRIYPHGKADLAEAVPDRWDKPEKVMNHRSRERIVRLANAIRADADGWEQRARADRSGGFAYAYVLPTGTEDKPAIEAKIREDLAVRANDPAWNEPSAVKTLTLEHHMAASRLGFETVFNAIDPVSAYKTSFRDGTLAPLRLFSERVLPLVEASHVGDKYGVMAVLRAHSPLLSRNESEASKAGATARMKTVRDASSKLLKLFDDGADPTCANVLAVLSETSLFVIPEVLVPFAGVDEASEPVLPDDGDEKMAAWRSFLTAPFSEIQTYRDYVADHSPYGTHQGVKGLEFPRVMVIADDASARFKAAASFEKLLGAKPPSDRDKKNEREDKETTYDRTRRLLYVTCTRAEESLALVVYSDFPDKVADTFKAKGWFADGEIITSIA